MYTFSPHLDMWRGNILITASCSCVPFHSEIYISCRDFILFQYIYTAPFYLFLLLYTTIRFPAFILNYVCMLAYNISTCIDTHTAIHSQTLTTHHLDGCYYQSHFSKCNPIRQDVLYFPMRYSETSFLHRISSLIWTPKCAVWESHQNLVSTMKHESV